MGASQPVRRLRSANGGLAPVPVMSALGAVPEGSTYLQFLNPNPDAITVYFSADAIAAAKVETIGPNAYGVVHLCPGHDMLVGTTSANVAGGNFPVWLFIT